MAPRASSRKSSSSQPRPPPAQRTYSDQVESAEVRRSRRAAILQLRIGRLAHIIGIASALALALAAVIAYGLLDTWDFIQISSEDIQTLEWLIPLIVGAAIAGFALAVKWEPYVADRNEPHFVMSIVALVAPLFLILLIVLNEYDYVQLGWSEWLYPASMLGLCLTEISLAMTWEGTSSRKSISIASASFPIVLMIFPIIWNFEPEELASILPMVYLGSAVAIHLSGAMLHIIASSTSVQQREVLKASDSKTRAELKEIEKKRNALAYREDALRTKESELEVYEKRLLDEMEAIEIRKAQVASYEEDFEQRLQASMDERQKLAKQQADIEDLKETLRMKQSEIDIQKGETDKFYKALAVKEAALVARERDANRLLLDAESKSKDAKNRLADVQAQEASLVAFRKELDKFSMDLVEREKELGKKESSIELKALEASLAKEQLGAVSEERSSVKVLEQQLLSKQENLAKREMALKTTEEEIKQRSEKAERLISRADKQMNELIEKESAVMAREQAIAEKESGLRSELEKIGTQLQEIESARTQATSRERQYTDMMETTRTKISAISTREEEIARKMSALEKREEKIKELEGRLVSEREKMNSKYVELLEKEKDLQAQEEEVSLRQAEVRAMEREVLESVDDVEEARAEYEAADEDDQARVLAFREKQLQQKEQEMKSKLYQREKELEKREQSLRSRLVKDIEDMEEAVDEEYAGERIKTGIERLDDLLMGGLPFGSNILCVGPPFIGKEVAMQLFVAEGLKKGVPSVIVTTSKPPAELAKEMGPMLPTFKEFEQLGLVYWVDATGLTSQDVGASENGDQVYRAKGPGDLEGISQAIDECISQVREHKAPYFRIVYFSLSMSITQTEEKLAYQFVQTLVGKMRQTGAIALYAIERGMHTEQQLESVQHHMTGAIQFKTERQKTLMSVQGIGDVQTRDWIEYRHTNKAIMIGAFSLERIR